MSEIQDNTLHETKEADFEDLQSLLEAANSPEFSPESGYTEQKQEFEKFENFFEIVQSTATEEAKSKKKDSTESQDTIDITDESEEDSPGEEKLVNKDETVEEGPNLSEPSEEELQQKHKGELNISDNNEELEAIESASSTPQSEKEQQSDSDASDLKDNDNELSLEEGEQTKTNEELLASDLERNAYQMGHKAALEEFERSMELEKKSLRELATSLFLINDKLQESTESQLKEKLHELFDELIGAKLKEFDATFIKKIKVASKSIVFDAFTILFEATLIFLIKVASNSFSFAPINSSNNSCNFSFKRLSVDSCSLSFIKNKLVANSRSDFFSSSIDLSNSSSAAL
jgi:hypothetical protein